MWSRYRIKGKGFNKLRCVTYASYPWISFLRNETSLTFHSLYLSYPVTSIQQINHSKAGVLAWACVCAKTLWDREGSRSTNSKSPTQRKCSCILFLVGTFPTLAEDYRGHSRYEPWASAGDKDACTCSRRCSALCTNWSYKCSFRLKSFILLMTNVCQFCHATVNKITDQLFKRPRQRGLSLLSLLKSAQMQVSRQ